MRALRTCQSLVFSALLINASVACTNTGFLGTGAGAAQTSKKKSAKVMTSDENQAYYEEFLDTATSEHLSSIHNYFAETVGDAEYEIDGFHFSGMASLTLDLKEDLENNHPDLAEKTFRERLEDLGIDPYETSGITDDEKQEALATSEKIMEYSLNSSSSSAEDSEEQEVALRLAAPACTSYTTQRATPQQTSECRVKVAKGMNSYLETPDAKAKYGDASTKDAMCGAYGAISTQNAQIAQGMAALGGKFDTSSPAWAPGIDRSNTAYNTQVAADMNRNTMGCGNP